MLRRLFFVVCGTWAVLVFSLLLSTTRGDGKPITPDEWMHTAIAAFAPGVVAFLVFRAGRYVVRG